MGAFGGRSKERVEIAGYHIEIDAHFPEVVNTELDGLRRTLVIPFMYGRPDLMRSGVFATSQDEPIKPGESCVLKIPGEYRAIRETLTVVTRTGIRVYSVSFGDGTGLKAGGVPFSFNAK